MSKERWIFGGVAIACIVCVIALMRTRDEPGLNSSALAPVSRSETQADLSGEAASLERTLSPDHSRSSERTLPTGPRDAARSASDASKNDAALIVRIVDDAEGLPMGGVRVNVDPVEKPISERFVARSTAALGVAPLTGDDGRAQIELPSGVAYRVRVHLESGDRSSVTIQVPKLQVGEHREVVATLPRPGVARIVGEVVRDGDRAPLPDAHVEVVRAGTLSLVMREGAKSEPTRDVLGRTVSDSAGRFEVEVSMWSSAYLRTSKPGYALALTPIEPARSSSEAPVVVTLERSARLRAVVLDVNGAPIADAHVRLSTPGSGLRQAWTSPVREVFVADETWIATTGESGRCELADLIPRVPISVQINVAGSVVIDEVNALVLEPGEERDVEWRVGAGCRLCGTMRDQRGEPVRAQEVWILRAETNGPRRFIPGQGAEAFARTTTDERGAFCFHAIPPGSWHVGPAATAQLLEPKRADDNGVVGRAILVEITADTREQRCELEVSRGLFIRGRVETPDGEAPANILVVARRPTSKTLETGSTNADGSFAIGPLFPEAFDLVARGQGQWASSEPVRVSAGDEGVVVRLRSAGVIAGNVVDARTGEVCTARVQITAAKADDEEGAQRSAGDSIGFRFDALAPGVYDLYAYTKDGRVGLLRDIVVHAGTVVSSLELRVDAGAKLELWYTGAQKFAIVEIKSGSVSIHRGSLKPGTSSTRSVPAGSLEVTLMNMDGEIVKSSRVDLEPGEKRALAFDDTP